MLDSFGDVLRHILDHAEKPQQTMFVGWRRHVDDRFDLIWVWSHAILGNDVAHVCHNCHLKLNISRIEHAAMMRSSPMTFTPWMSANASSLRFCNTSLVELMPNGILRNRFHLHAVWNVQRYEDSSDNFTCQYPPFMSITVNIFMPLCRLCTSDVVGISYPSRLIALLCGFGSRHTRIRPSRFSMMTRL